MGDTATMDMKAGNDVEGAVPATGDAMTQTGEKTKTPRVKKNATATKLDVNDPSSAPAWLAEFYEQSSKQEVRKGYDQHWNKDGFIHAGPADRLPNSGGAKMAVFIGDMLAKREIAGDVEAGKFLDFIVNFCQTRRSALQAEIDAKILAQAEAILAKQDA